PARTTITTTTIRTRTTRLGIRATGRGRQAPGAAAAPSPAAAGRADTAAGFLLRRSHGRQADDGPAQPEDRVDGPALRRGGRLRDVHVDQGAPVAPPLRRRDLRLRGDLRHRLRLLEVRGSGGPLTIRGFRFPR